MAVSASTVEHIINGHVQAPSDGVAQGLYEQSSVQKGPLGAKREMPDGRIFRYCYFNSAVGAGQLAAVDQSVMIQTSFDGAFVNSAGTAADISSGVKSIHVKSADITSDDIANQYAGGYLHITDEGGEGYTYRIKGNSVGGGPATNTMRLDLYDPIQTDLDSEDSCSITGSIYNNLAISKAGTDDVPVGVPLMDVSASRFAWVQTAGICTVLADESAGTVQAGAMAQVSDGVDGALQPFGAGATNSESDHLYVNYPLIGYFLTVAVDTEYVAARLTFLE